MRILAFTDTHGKPRFLKTIQKKSASADIIICCGDFTVFENNMPRILSDLDKIGKKLLLIHGNHEDERHVEEACLDMKNITFLHRKKHNFMGFTFIGYGGMGFSAKDDDFEKFSKKYLSEKNMILITHAPPYNTKVDQLWSHNGNKSITQFIKKAQPTLALCGHFHELFGKQDIIGKTRIINPGPEGKVIEV
ncbi:metallophosphoesterase family protein [Candidatus Woesearchaeota archaeon]|nr:metallophosphoesterase family protein [Candidatus Woesearchaeota archaeon]